MASGDGVPGDFVPLDPRLTSGRWPCSTRVLGFLIGSMPPVGTRLGAGKFGPLWSGEGANVLPVSYPIGS